MIWPAVAPYAEAIELVGSTSVEGLAAKPIIDIDIIYQNPQALTSIIAALSSIGYSHLGDLGIPSRDAFKSSVTLPRHNLYACLTDSLALRNHLTLRDHLRENSRDRYRYSKLKRDLAARYPNDIDAYIEGKTKLITEILSQYEISENDIADITTVNRKMSYTD